jgi:hypothetical protein
MLIACDTCEAHYHLACAMPPLESIPDGTWICGNCRRETRSMLSSQDESCGTSMNGGNDFAEKEMGDDFQDDNKLDAGDHIVLEGADDTRKRKFRRRISTNRYRD